MTDPEKANRPLRGVLLLAGAALCFSVAALLAKLIDTQIGSPQLVLLRSVFMVVTVGAWALRRGDPLFVGEPRAAAMLLARGLLGTVGFLLFFGALRRIPLADTVILFQSHPAIVALLSPFILGERLKPVQALLVLGSIVGVGIVVGPTGEGSLEGRLMALGCATTTGIAVALVRRLSRTVPSLTIAIAFPAMATVLIGPAMLAGLPDFEWTAPSARDWVLIGSFAPLATVAQVLLTMGLGCVPAARGAAISNLQVVFAILFGLLVLGEVPSVTSLGGATVIIVCLLLLQRRPRGGGQDEVSC